MNAPCTQSCCTSSTIFWINQNSEILDEVKARCAQVFISNTRYPRPAIVYFVVLAIAIGHLISYIDLFIFSSLAFLLER